MRVTGISFSKVARPQNGVVQDDNGRQRGKADGVDVLPKQSIHLERTEKEIIKKKTNKLEAFAQVFTGFCRERF